MRLAPVPAPAADRQAVGGRLPGRGAEGRRPETTAGAAEEHSPARPPKGRALWSVEQQ
ncbi:hypothetical protein [Actinopolyspora saharensis]|uniref:hypothetical protein n=1 Tax=Actinopolyspora saharensis TaxID=995062 RepID=UPI001587569B|nr:hypothetical protein [Actinopolyspora saharensis]